MPNLRYPSAALRIAKALGALSLGVALAFSAPPAGAQTIKDGGDLRAALTGEPDVLDPAISSIYTGAQVYEGIFSKLIDIAPDNSFVPDLATAWTQTDPKTWTFKLVTNATFHNGEAFTSADVKYTFERILDPKTASAYAGLYAQIASVDAPDPATVVFHLKSPFGAFLTNLATNGEIVKIKYGRSNPEVYTEVAATRLLAALGFPADRMFVINRVRCFGCPPDPFPALECVNATD